MKKETVVFVHGAWHGAWCWDKYFRPKFEKNGYDVITFNLPGHDRPGKVKGINNFTLADYVKALEAQVSQLDELPIIIGHSMGGMILQKFLEKNQCKKAVLVASTPPYGMLRALPNTMKHPSFWSTLLTRDLYRMVDNEEKCSMMFFSEDLPKEELSESTSQMCSESFAIFNNLNFPRVKSTYNPQIPMLVIGSLIDLFVSENDLKATAKRYKADLIMMDDVAHDMMIDTKHEKASDAIIKWLQSQNISN